MQRDFIFKGGSSTRYHTMTVHDRQTIADHSFGVAWICEILTNRSASKELIMAALAHDLAEHKVGDIPAPAKRALNLKVMYDSLEQNELDDAEIGIYARLLSEDEKVVLRFADMLEGMIFCLKERRMGNIHVSVAFKNFRDYVSELYNLYSCDPAKKAFNIATELCDEWEDITDE